MMENMIGDVARTMQDDRRAAAARRTRLAEAESMYVPHAQGTRLRKRRAAIAKALQALAMRLAPPPPATAPRPTMVTGAQ